MTPIDRDLARALDAFEVPPLSPDFADRVMAKALAGTPIAPTTPPRRSGRGPWVRRHRIAMGLIAGGLMSATAAAAGIFGDVGITIPALQQIVERVTRPAPVETVDPPSRRAAALPKALPEAAVTAPAAPGEGPGITPEQLEAGFRIADERRQIRREVVTRRLETAVERRIAERQAAGLPVPTPEQRQQFRARIQQRVAERDAVAASARESFRNDLRTVVRERQSEVPATPPVAAAPVAPAVPVAPASPTPAEALPEASPRADADADVAGRATLADRPVLTPAQREALRQLRQRRIERLQRQRQP